MKKITYALLLLSAVSAQASETYINEKFTQGMPANFTLVNLDGGQVETRCFKDKVKPQNTWFTCEVEGSGIGALSASLRTDAETPTDNWLITPKFKVTSENAWFRWKAQSVHHNYPESYEVVVFTKDDMSDAKVHFSTEAESYFWTTRLVSLKEYAGQEVYVAIRHTSTNQYLLAVDNLFAGELTDNSVEHNSKVRHFFSNDKDAGNATIKGSFRNIGRKLNLSEIQLTIGDSTTYSMPCSKELDSNAELNYEFYFPFEKNETQYNYVINAVEADGKLTKVLSEYAVCTDYQRTILVEKFTGMWCNSCTAASPYIYLLDHQYGDELAIVEVHVWGGSEEADPMYNYAYHNDMYVMNVPMIRYNRNRDVSQTSLWTSDGYVQRFASTPTNAKIESSAQWTEDGKVKVTSTVQFNEDKENSSNVYRIGYIVIEDEVRSSNYRQQNNATQTSAKEYYYLPTTIPASMMTYNRVVRGGETEESYQALGTGSGIKGNLPAVIEARTDYTAEDIITMPATVTNPQNVRIVAVLYVYSSVMNVSIINEITNFSGIEDASTLGNSDIAVYGSEGSLTVALPEDAPYSVSVYGIDGKQIASASGVGNLCSFNNLQAGCYIVSAEQANLQKTNKIIIK